MDPGGCLIELIVRLVHADNSTDHANIGLMLLGIATAGGAVCGLWYWITHSDMATSPLLYFFVFFGLVGAVGIWLTIDGWLKSRGE